MITMFNCEGHGCNLLYATQILLKQICLLLLLVHEGFKLLLVDILNRSRICGLYLICS